MAIERPRAAISWSGGKDSCAALQRARASFNVVAMVTMVDETAARSRSHGLRPEVLDAQADRLGVHRIMGRCTWASYTDAFSAALEVAAAEGMTHVIFGDILFEEHRRWAERVCAPHGLTAVEPLWGESTDSLFEQWVESGGDALIVTARTSILDASWLGRSLSLGMLGEFKRLGVDPCGERGEYHTLVRDAPAFSAPIRIRHGHHVERAGCWALDLSIDHG